MPGPQTAALRLPHAQQLAALGTVLCLYRPQHGGELSGWAQASHAESQAGVDSDGLRESLAFFDQDGRCCWRLFLLPDSDFLAWDRLLVCLPVREEVEPAAGVGERLWRKLAGRLRGEQWQACVLKLRCPPRPGSRCWLPAWKHFLRWVRAPRDASSRPKGRKRTRYSMTAAAPAPP
jgi:hypothetical protein